MQSRRSLLVWKIFGERLDGFSNDDHPSEPEPGAGYFAHKGERVPTDKNRARYDLDFLGSQMPPPAAVAGTYTNAASQRIKVEPLSEEDRFTIVRWIDLGCPIDLDYDLAHPDTRGFGWISLTAVGADVRRRSQRDRASISFASLRRRLQDWAKRLCDF